LEDQKNKPVTAEVEQRLDDIFGLEDDDGTDFMEDADFIEEDTGSDDPPSTFTGSILDEDSPLRDLKGIVLSLDWEITDENMNRFLEEVELLKIKFQGEKIPRMYLQILDSVGKYIRKRKVRSHPESIRLLSSAYKSFEKALMNPETPKAEKRKALYKEITKLKLLKEKIGREKSEHIPPRAPEEAPQMPPTEPEAAPPSTPGMKAPVPAHEAFAYALEEIKQVIKSEFQAIRAELKLWREDKQ